MEEKALIKVRFPNWIKKKSRKRDINSPRSIGVMIQNANVLSNKGQQYVNPERVFFVFVLISIAIFWIIMFMTRSENIDMYFLRDHRDTSMDYFNMLFNLKGSDPWSANSNYPAICFLFWKVMYHFLPTTEYENGFDLRTDMVAQLGYILFVLTCMVIIWEAIHYMAKGTNIEKTLFGCALMFSGPMFFLLERGNILIAVLALSLVFLALYNSKKVSYRVIAYICLAIAAAIKIYPAALGLLVLWKKRYKETVALIVLGIAFFIIPFFAFDGVESLQKMLYGMGLATDVQTGSGLGSNFCMNNLVQLIGAAFGVNIRNVPGWVSLVAFAFCLSLFAISRQEWQKLYALVLLCIWCQGFSYTYILVLLFLPIISFLFRSDRQQQGSFRIGYAILFALTIIPYPLPMVDHINRALGLPDMSFPNLRFPVSWGTIIINAVLVVIALIITTDSIVYRVKKKHNGWLKENG